MPKFTCSNCCFCGVMTTQAGQKTGYCRFGLHPYQDLLVRQTVYDGSNTVRVVKPQHHCADHRLGNPLAKDPDQNMRDDLVSPQFKAWLATT